MNRKKNSDFKCQIGVLPLGTGNDLARVLGWGSALDDDNQLPKLLETFERATTKMLDRWSIMAYTYDTHKHCTPHPAASPTSRDNLLELEGQLLSSINDLLANHSLPQLIHSTHNLNNSLLALQHNFSNNLFFSPKLTHNPKMATMHTYVCEQLIAVDNMLAEFFCLLRGELKTAHTKDNKSTEEETSSTNSGECDEPDDSEKLKLIEALFNSQSVSSQSNSLYRKHSVSHISKRFNNRQKILIKSNSLKRTLRQIVQLIDVMIMFESVSSSEASPALSRLNERINELLLATGPTEPKSASSLAINKNGLFQSECPLASEEHSCLSSPNASKLSRSMDSLCKNFDSLAPSSQNTCSHRVSIRISSPSNEPSLNSFNESDRLLPDIVVDDMFDQAGLRHAQFNSKSVPGLNLLADFKQRGLSQQFLYPGSTACLNNSLNASAYMSSASSNCLSTTCIPVSPSGYSSSGTCLNRTPVPSPRISKKYFRVLNHTKSVQLSETARMVHETNHFLDDHYYAVSNPVNLPNTVPITLPQKTLNALIKHKQIASNTKTLNLFFPTNEHDNYITYSQCLSNSNPLYTNSNTVQPNQNQAPLYQVYDMQNPKKVYTIKFKKFPDQYMDYFELQDYLDKLKPEP
ncbi:diacylglycerol kinase delta [Brachionus plicatilis]|uniref:Diacylglycerol kinase delta n=1 Tax=Brachionus plicatilis TaxID=10195 RepID=A0A3M7QRP9_BRAPC|nr:diacylglycerol kinase delta [Brachionus plicatilis]